ncbi:MAG: MvaI/BcnI restriction endonuclease family protein [Bacilli bacterium]|nr:MvaI/BcnI restriction endonuclease family protein [Bacilli bacterium]
MNESIEKLKKKFLEIKRMGYVESTRSGPTGIGKTFEDLLGKDEDSRSDPDFYGIEIKTKQFYSIRDTTLFNLTPTGKEGYEIPHLVNAYGYPDRILKNKKVLIATAYGNCLNCVAAKYLMGLEVDYKNRIIRLKILNMNMDVIEDDVYWEFDAIEERLCRKLKYLAVINASKKKVDGKDYYHYKNINFYKLKDFFVFLKLIEMGIICIEFHIGVFRDGTKKGEIHDRGTSFRIKESNLLYLFDTIT